MKKLIIVIFLQFTIQLNIHIIPHSHMDPGWGWVIETYYNDRVRQIYSSVYNSLFSDIKRTFVICEIIFFKMWYEEQPINVQSNFKEIVKNKQVEFVGGGFVQNDEATTRYSEMIFNLRLGNQLF